MAEVGDVLYSDDGFTIEGELARYLEHYNKI